MSIVRLHILVEGQTEEEFVNSVLKQHLGNHHVMTGAHMITTNRRLGRAGRGGFVSYAHLKSDLRNWFADDRKQDAWFTTMIDLYAMPPEFPGYQEGQRIRDPYERVRFLEAALADDIAHPRFIPHIQLHEFESLIFADPQQLDWAFLEHEAQIQQLVMLANETEPEQINDQRPPSKRIIELIPEYQDRKASSAPIVVEKIGLNKLRERCPHFTTWLTKLEGLAGG